MERIYSAFFTNERRQEVPLTEEALAKHNKKQSHENLGVQASSDRVPGLERHATHDSDDSPLPSGAEMNMAHQTPHQLRTTVSTRLSLMKELKPVVKAALRAFLYAYGAKAFTAMLMASRKWSSIEYGYADAVRLLLRADTIRFGTFSGTLVGLFRLSEVLMRLSRGKSDSTNLAVAGGVSGLALLLDSPSRRSAIAVYIFVRMLDVFGRQLVATGALPNWKYSSEGLFALSNGFILYAALCDPSLLPKGYYRWIMQVGCMTHEGIEYTIRQRLRGEVDELGQPIPFRPCQPHYHMESCVAHSVKEWVHGLGRSLQIYLPVHFLPAIIFRLHRLRESPVLLTSKISYAALCSSAFLTTYQTIAKLVVCVSRNAISRDSGVVGFLSGVLSGSSLFFEDPKRRLELMLYCAPRAMDIIWRMLARRGLVRYVKHSEVALFCISMAIVMSREPRYFKPTYLRILRFIFGLTDTSDMFLSSSPK